MVLIGLYDVVWDFHQALLRKLPPSLPMPDQTLSTPAFPDTHSVALAASSSVLLLFGGLFRCS
jgi:membrane-associated phospholipid phosphatase